MGAPLAWVLLAQLTDVIGNLLGQRASRIDFGGSRRMTVAIAVISAVQVFVILGILQLAAPALTGQIYVNNKVGNCTEEVDVQGHPPDFCPETGGPGSRGAGSCTVIECPSQGPFSLWSSILLHPLLRHAAPLLPIFTYRAWVRAGVGALHKMRWVLPVAVHPVLTWRRTLRHAWHVC